MGGGGGGGGSMLGQYIRTRVKGRSQGNASLIFKNKRSIYKNKRSIYKGGGHLEGRGQESFPYGLKSGLVV